MIILVLLLAVSVIIAFLMTALLFKILKQEDGSYVILFPSIFFAVLAWLAVLLQITIGWSWVTLIITHGKCAYMECLP